MKYVEAGQKIHLSALFVNNTLDSNAKSNTINLTPPPMQRKKVKGGSAVYDGYFQIENVKKDPDNPDDVAKITVHHGKNGDSFLTAKMQINNKIVDLPKIENLAVAVGYLYLAATADSSNHLTLEYLLDNNINFEEDKVKILIGKFTSQDDKFIFQRYYRGGFAQFLTIGGC